MLLFLFRTFLSPPFRNGETMTENVIFYLSWHHHHRKVAVSVSQREIQFTECDDGVFSWIDNVGKISPNWGKARNSSGQGIIFQPTHCFFLCPLLFLERWFYGYGKSFDKLWKIVGTLKLEFIGGDYRGGWWFRVASSTHRLRENPFLRREMMASLIDCIFYRTIFGAFKVVAC